MDDREAWDTFVDNEGGSIFHYIDWKYIHENRGDEFFPLIIETDSSRFIGIFTIVKEKNDFFQSSGPQGWQNTLLRQPLFYLNDEYTSVL